MLTVSKQEQLFNQLLARPENKSCADCGSKSPTWASIDFGVFVCLNCSGAHRALGPSITRVRSTKLDTWQESWAELLILGNQQCNNYWEHNIVGAKKPTPSSTLDDIKRFVQDKYVKKRYASAGEANPVVELKGRIARGENTTVSEPPVVVKAIEIPIVKQKQTAAPVLETKGAANHLMMFGEDDDNQFSEFHGAPEQPVVSNGNSDILNFDDHHPPQVQKSQSLNFDDVAGHHYSQINASHSHQMHQHPHHHLLQHHNHAMQGAYAHTNGQIYAGYHQPMQPHHNVYNPYQHQMTHQQPYMYAQGVPATGLYPQHHMPNHTGYGIQF